MLQGIAFYVFSAVMIASALMVIAARNPVHSVLFLILAFVNASGLFVLMGAEFLAMILVVVYVGAVAVLFLFFMFAMVKAIVPRYRYDQLMRLGWKVFLPLSLAMVAIVAAVIQYGGFAAAAVK